MQATDYDLQYGPGQRLIGWERSSEIAADLMILGRCKKCIIPLKYKHPHPVMFQVAKKNCVCVLFIGFNINIFLLTNIACLKGMGENMTI